MNKKEKAEFNKYLSNCDFESAKKMVKKLSTKELEGALVDFAYRTENLFAYAFIWYLLKDHENEDYHYIASIILALGLNHLPNAYNLSLFHARKAIELDRSNIDNKQWLLFFYNLPEKLINDNEALAIANEVIKK